jgi:hypothetical protein
VKSKKTGKTYRRRGARYLECGACLCKRYFTRAATTEDGYTRWEDREGHYFYEVAPRISTLEIVNVQKQTFLDKIREALFGDNFLLGRFRS